MDTVLGTPKSITREAGQGINQLSTANLLKIAAYIYRVCSYSTKHPFHLQWWFIKHAQNSLSKLLQRRNMYVAYLLSILYACIKMLEGIEIIMLTLQLAQ